MGWKGVEEDGEVGMRMVTMYCVRVCNCLKTTLINKKVSFGP